MATQAKEGSMNTEMTIYDQSELSPAQVSAQVQTIQELMRSVMREGEHWGTLPGSDKPCLYKAGAEKLSFAFRAAPSYDVRPRLLEGSHREYEVICTLTHIGSGHLLGQGVGLCSTMESKYRYRQGYEVTGDPIPSDAKERKSEYRAQGLGMKKVSGQWEWVRYRGREEIEDVADTYNTVLKMAKKRAHVDACLTVFAASDIFTQDIEDATSIVPEDNAPPENLRGPESPPRQESANKPMRAAPRGSDGLTQRGPVVESARRRVLDYLHRLVAEKIYTAADAKEIEQKANRMSVLVPASAIAELAKLLASLPKLGISDPGLDAIADKGFDAAARDPSDEPAPEHGELY